MNSELEIRMDAMFHIALLENSQKSKANYLSCQNLPTFYMQDFTVLGFAVKGIEAAKDLLLRNGYSLEPQNGGYNIIFDESGQLREISQLFAENGIDSSFSDIADTLYQA